MAKEKGIFERLEAEVIKDAGEYVKDKVKRKAIAIGEISVLIFMAFVLISFGLATLIGSYVEVLSNGFNFMILGVLFLLLSFMIKV